VLFTNVTKIPWKGRDEGKEKHYKGIKWIKNPG
jgi:hypothetical protein